ncbi:hypothetical protein Q1M64_27340 [Sinorhizobium meliloti]|nr:hypothetical protein Q1M64_27340 [Sinorhizobium meliloti]
MPDTDEIARSRRRVPRTPAADPNAEGGSGLKMLGRPLRVMAKARSWRWLRFAFGGATEEGGRAEQGTDPRPATEGADADAAPLRGAAVTLRDGRSIT